MEKKSFKVYSPSHARGNKCLTHLHFPNGNFCYVVEESDAHNYEHLGVELMVIPDRPKEEKNIVTTRNWILNNRKSDFVTMMDDDVRSIIRVVERKNIKLNPDQVQELLVHGYEMALDVGAGIWGINLVADPKAYSINQPFHFSLPVLGPFSNIIDCELRYDERFSLKEDYDFYLQQLMKHRKVLRFQGYQYLADHQNFDGGCELYRTREKEMKQCEMFQKKWGSEIAKWNFLHKGSINMIIKPPI